MSDTDNFSGTRPVAVNVGTHVFGQSRNVKCMFDGNWAGAGEIVGVIHRES